MWHSKNERPVSRALSLSGTPRAGAYLLPQSSKPSPGHFPLDTEAPHYPPAPRLSQYILRLAEIARGMALMILTSIIWLAI